MGFAESKFHFIEFMIQLQKKNRLNLNHFAFFRVAIMKFLPSAICHWKNIGQKINLPAVK